MFYLIRIWLRDKDCEEHLTKKGKGWVYETDNMIVGFSIIDLTNNNVWALFLRPESEGKGIGRKLHNVMLDWYFDQTKKRFGWELHQIPGQKNFMKRQAGKGLAGMAKKRSLK